MENKKIFLLDDDPNYLHLVNLFLTDMGCKEVIQVSTFAQAIEQIRPDIDAYILDIELQNKTMEGIAVAEAVRKHSPDTPIIFFTSHFLDHYYQKCRHLQPAAFLSKEISRFKLYQALDLAFLKNNSIKISQFDQEYSTATSQTPFLEPENKKYFFKIGDKYKSYPIEDIHYFFADGKFSLARINNRNFPTKVQLKVLEEELENSFVRVHKKYLVNLKFIVAINTKAMNIDVAGASIPIGPAYKQAFLSKINFLK